MIYPTNPAWMDGRENAEFSRTGFSLTVTQGGTAGISINCSVATFQFRVRPSGFIYVKKNTNKQ